MLFKMISQTANMFKDTISLFTRILLVKRSFESKDRTVYHFSGSIYCDVEFAYANANVFVFWKFWSKSLKYVKRS